MADIYAQILELKDKGENACLCTIVGSSIGMLVEGTKMLVRENGEIVNSTKESNIDLLLQEKALEALRTGKPNLINMKIPKSFIKEGSEEAELEVYFEPILSEPTLYIFGGGHVSLYVTRIAKMVGFKVVVIDDRPDFSNPQRFPEADETIAREFEEVLAELKPSRPAYLVIVTRGHLHDEIVLEWAVKTDATYIGMIGSRRKIIKLYQDLEQKGIRPETLKKVHAPIGLDIKAETPEEIAVSIVAELIKTMRERKVATPTETHPCQG